MVYKVDGNPQLDSSDWSMYSNILNSELCYMTATRNTQSWRRIPDQYREKLLGEQPISLQDERSEMPYFMWSSNNGRFHTADELSV